MLFDLVNRTSSERKVKKTLDIQVWVLSRSSRERTENVLGKSQINLPGTSLERQIKTSPGCQIVTSPGGQIGTSLGQSNRIFRGRPGEVRGGRPGDQYLSAGLPAVFFEKSILKILGKFLENQLGQRILKLINMLNMSSATNVFLGISWKYSEQLL